MESERQKGFERLKPVGVWLQTPVNDLPLLTVSSLLSHSGLLCFPVLQPTPGGGLGKADPPTSRTWYWMVIEYVFIPLSLCPYVADCRGSSKTQVYPLGMGNVWGWNSFFDVWGKKIKKEKFHGSRLVDDLPCNFHSPIIHQLWVIGGKSLLPP